MAALRPQIWFCLGCGRCGSVAIEEHESLHLVAMKVQDAHRAGLLRECSDENVRVFNHELDGDIRQLERALASWVMRFNEAAKEAAKQQVRAERAEREFRMLYEFLSRHETAREQVAPEQLVIDLNFVLIDAFIDATRQQEYEEVRAMDVVEATDPTTGGPAKVD
jgi:hypothetical protein